MDPWRQSVIDAIVILNRLYQETVAWDDPMPRQRNEALHYLDSAMRYLARPDRAIYPKTRRGSKRNPVTRK
jgi:hypothetical protein